MNEIRKVLVLQAIIIMTAISCTQQVPPPNILWIVAEDLSPDLGCYGNPQVNTFNMDQLAAEGSLFSNVFVTAPVCSASRSAMITGCYQSSINAQNHRTLEEAKTPLPDSIHLLSKYFKDAGYYTILEGPKKKAQRKTPGPWGSGKTDYNFIYDESEFFQGTQFEDVPEGSPFFAQLTLKMTHRGEWWHMGEERNSSVNKTDIEIPPFYPDHSISRESFGAYYDAINTLDKHLGKILDKLDSLGLRENTIIVFTADHGRAMPRGKQFCYDQGIHVPLIIAGPGIDKGICDDRLLSSLDLSASLLELAGIEPSGTLHGFDFLNHNDFEREFIVAARDRCDETVFRIRAVRSDEYKYIRNFMPERPYTAQNRYKDTRYPMMQLLKDQKKEGTLPEGARLFMEDRKPNEELYDLKNDSFEINNLAEDNNYSKELAQHRQYLQEWLDEFPDYGAVSEPDSIMKKILIERRAKYGY